MKLIEGNSAVVVPWHNPEQLEKFLSAWGIERDEPGLILQHDSKKEGGAAMKNRGVDRAVEAGAELVVVLDDDCYPCPDGVETLKQLADMHRVALQPQWFPLFQSVTEPQSRGTPYGERERMALMDVACSMGFWIEVGDYCAVRALAFGHQEMEFSRELIYGRYFPLCGMNIAFRPHEWDPWWRFIDVPRYDDIWQGWLWQKEAYRRGCCFNLAGPLVRHSRQSNVWRNLADEAMHLEANETLWREIAGSPDSDYEALLRLLPAGARPAT